MKGEGWRKNRKPVDQTLREIRRAKSLAADRYGIGGLLKTGRNAPKPVTLAPVNLPPEKE